RSWLEPALLAVAGTWLLSSAFSPEPLASFLHVRKLYAFGLIYLAAEAARDPRVRRRVVAAVLTGAVLGAAAGYVIFAFRALQQPGYRFQALLSNSMTSGGVLCASALWALGTVAAARGARRAGAAAALVVLVPALVLTQTRSSWLGFGAGATVVLIALAPRWWWTLPTGLVLGLWLAPARIVARFASIVDPHEPGNQGRLSMWRSARDIVRDHPWVGAGCQDLLSLYRRYRYPDWTFESGHFHNNFVQVAVMTGIVGLVAFLFWHAAVLRQLMRARRAARGEDRALAAAGLGIFTALVVSGMFDFTFGDQEVVYHTYLAVGLALAILPARPAIAPEPPGGPA
ncbi:MAG TPA: O-antigen ligase family protein, partial [Candidatus Eisenbacteria bacterium]